MPRNELPLNGRATEARLALPAEPASVRAARGFIGATLAGTAADECSGDARLMVSELVTNALIHAAPPLELIVRVNVRRLRIEVTDHVDRLPELLPVQDEGMAGRGLRIVEELADGWGAEPLARGGKIVWFELTFG